MPYPSLDDCSMLKHISKSTALGNTIRPKCALARGALLRSVLAANHTSGAARQISVNVRIRLCSVAPDGVRNATTAANPRNIASTAAVMARARARESTHEPYVGSSFSGSIRISADAVELIAATRRLPSGSGSGQTLV